MEKIMKLDRLTLGVCYYPEHWPRGMWEDDLVRMKACGIATVRIAEFAWTIFEPREGEFSFSFFDDFLTLAQKHGMNVIFCTPTATPPAWLTERYPEVLNARRDGTLLRHGMRGHVSHTSEKYLELCAKITERLAAHYGPHPAVIGWQIDNELNCEVSEYFSQADHAAFRRYLKEKFATLDALNEAMGTVFWNQTYTAWEQIYLGRPLANDRSNNPHMELEAKRFFSKATAAFCKMQADILRRFVRPGQFVTTNGIFGHINNHEMTDTALDFITFDSYPNFAYEASADGGPLLDRRWSAKLAEVRSISPVFGIMEQQSGAGGWNARIRQPQPKPGQMRLWTYQSVGNGADFISYFRWRTSPIGTEIYWYGLNDWSNRTGSRRIRELMSIHSEFEKLSEVAGSRMRAQIALVRDYDNLWDGENDQWYGELAYESGESFLAAAQFAHVPTDILFLRDDAAHTTTLEELMKYRLLIYPHPAILTPERAALLARYVERGGFVLFGSRSGYKDAFGRCTCLSQPGPVAALCGVEVSDDTYLARDEEVFVHVEGRRYPLLTHIETLEPYAGTEVLGVFDNGFMKGAAAFTVRKMGKGAVYYCGGGFGPAFAQDFLARLSVDEPYREIVELPRETELLVRVKDGTEYLFVLNYSEKEVSVTVKTELYDLLSGRALCGTVSLCGYGVLVLKKEA